jgi:hypothetical protein
MVLRLDFPIQASTEAIDQGLDLVLAPANDLDGFGSAVQGCASEIVLEQSV